VGRGAGLDGCGKSRPHWDSIPGLSSLLRVTIPTELSQPHVDGIHTEHRVFFLKIVVIAPIYSFTVLFLYRSSFW
jgi:hypothetical protein